MIVTVDDARRPLGRDSFIDITTKECIHVGPGALGGFDAQFAVNLTTDEARQVKVRCLTPDAAAETVFRAAAAAYSSNETYLALPAPTTAQTLAQVTAATRQLQALIRLALGTVLDA